MSVAQNDTPNVKVLFKITDDEGEVEETLWAADLGKHHYRLANLPFYAYGVSLDDVFYAPRVAQDQVPTFRRIISTSGRRTLRVILNEAPSSGSNSEKLIKALNRLGCGEARAIEQALIKRNPGFQNIRNSISPKHSWYEDAVNWGESWLKTNGH
jgi:hypothetical protein